MVSLSILWKGCFIIAIMALGKHIISLFFAIVLFVFLFVGKNVQSNISKKFISDEEQSNKAELKKDFTDEEAYFIHHFYEGANAENKAADAQRNLFPHTHSPLPENHQFDIHSPPPNIVAPFFV